MAAFFFFFFALNLSVSCRSTFFSLISGIKTSWKAINIDYPLHVHSEVNNQLLLWPIGWFLVTLTTQKHLNLGNWEYDYFIKIGLLWSCIPWARKPICRGWHSEVLGNTGLEWLISSAILWLPQAGVPAQWPESSPRNEPSQAKS